MTEEEKNELESKTIEEIKKLERKKPVLLVGKNKELIQNAVKEIYYTQTGRFVTFFPSPFGNDDDDLITYFDSNLREYSCIGKTETEIKHALFSPKNLIRYYKNGDMFLVRGLDIPRILECLADSVEQYYTGVLIINVPSMDIVPQELLDQFEIIELEPKKKGIPDTPEPKGKMGFQKP